MVLHASVMFDRIAGCPIHFDRAKLLLRYQATEMPTVRKALTAATRFGVELGEHDRHGVRNGEEVTPHPSRPGW